MIRFAPILPARARGARTVFIRAAAFLLAGATLLPCAARAEEPGAKIVIRVDTITQKTRVRIAVPDTRVLGPADGVLERTRAEIRDVLRDDLRYSGVFDLAPPDQYALAGPTTPEHIPYDAWRRQTDWLTLVDLSSKGGDLVVEGRLYVVVSDQKMVLGKRYQAKLDTARKVAHTFADAIIEAVGGKPGVCNTQIAFVSDRDGRDRQIYAADYDGYAPRRLTQNRKMNMSPDWSPDNSEIVYTSYLKNNPDLYVMSTKPGGTSRVLFARPGMNNAPAWSPDGKLIAFSSSKEGGGSEIYTIQPGGGGLRKVTSNRGIDTVPAWLPNGRELTFTSDRGGRPDIWQVDLEGLNPRRVIPQSGWFNDGGTWAPDGDRLAFTGMTGGEFQVFVLTLATGAINQLTSEGSNEAPSWSPDGRQIAFASTRGGRTSKTTDIYVVNDDGQNLRRITSGGNNLSPAWSHR